MIRWLYRFGQLLGASACLTIGIGLSLGWLYEPRLWLKSFEIIGSFVAAILLCADLLDIHPKLD